MGTERDTLFEGPCNCGKGSLRVDHCSPDHGWPTSTPFWYETSINCRDCEKRFELQRQGKHFVFVEKSEIAKRTALGEEAYKRGQALLRTPSVKKLLSSFIDMLNHQKSMAAVHRILRDASLEYSSIGTFRKRWAGAESWVKSYLSANDLPKVMKLLHTTDKATLDEVKEIADLWKESQVPPPAFGKPVFSI